jgi:hypothetical protein
MTRLPGLARRHYRSLDGVDVVDAGTAGHYATSNANSLNMLGSSAALPIVALLSTHFCGLVQAVTP